MGTRPCRCRTTDARQVLPRGAGGGGIPARLRRVQHVLFLDMHYSAGTPRNAHGSLGSPDHPNRATEGDTSKVWPRANCAHSSGAPARMLAAARRSTSASASDSRSRLISASLVPGGQNLPQLAGNQDHLLVSCPTCPRLIPGQGDSFPLRRHRIRLPQSLLKRRQSSPHRPVTILRLISHRSRWTPRQILLQPLQVAIEAGWDAHRP